MPQEAVRVTHKTWPLIVSRYPNLEKVYSQEEVEQLIVDYYYLITNPREGWRYWFITEDQLMLSYGTVSPDVHFKFVPVTPVA